MREVIHPARYQILEVMSLPEEVQEVLECPANDTGRIINPKYHPKLKQWLLDNQHDAEACYIAWWSW